LLTQILTVSWKLGSLLGYKPYQYAVVEAPYPSKAACISMWSTNKVYEPCHMQWMGIWNHWQPVTITLFDPDFDSQLKAWVTAGLETIPLCSGWGSIPIQSCMHINVEHMWCMNQFICSGWAYGTIGNPLPSPMLTQILKVGVNLPGSHC
jgi:hypothetical protein